MHELPHLTKRCFAGQVYYRKRLLMFAVKKYETTATDEVPTPLLLPAMQRERPCTSYCFLSVISTTPLLPFAPYFWMAAFPFRTSTFSMAS